MKQAAGTLGEQLQAARVVDELNVFPLDPLPLVLFLQMKKYTHVHLG
jgi:hypothetical protein